MICTPSYAAMRRSPQLAPCQHLATHKLIVMLVMLDFQYATWVSMLWSHACKGVEGEALRSEEWRAHALKRMSKGLARNRESQRVHKKNLSSGMQSAHRATRCAGTTLTTDWWRYLNSRYNATM